jgi:hypothetical protein
MSGVDVKFFVQGGLTVGRLLSGCRGQGRHHLLEKILGYQPDIVAIMLGDNDLSNLNAGEVVEDLEYLMSVLKELMAVQKFVFFFSVFFQGLRTRGTRRGRRNCTT